MPDPSDIIERAERWWQAVGIHDASYTLGLELVEEVKRLRATDLMERQLITEWRKTADNLRAKGAMLARALRAATDDRPLPGDEALSRAALADWQAEEPVNGREAT